MPSVLIVDDEPYQRTLVREILTPRHELTLSEAETGAEALMITRAQRPDVILLDVMMPGISGLEVCKHIKTDPALISIRVILLTALALDSYQLLWTLAGADDYIQKPPDEYELYGKIRAALKARVK